MDYTGLTAFGKVDYPINRVLTEEEKANQLDPKQQASDEPLDWLSVIKVNSTFLELADRWYSVKGSYAWVGVILATIGLNFSGFLLFSIFSKVEWAAWLVGVFGIAAGLLFVFAGYAFMKLDMFRLTHYPMRLNRKTRKVYVTQPRDEVLEANWDDLFFCISKSQSGTTGNWGADVRAHVLADDGETVLHTFTLMYALFGDESGARDGWECVRRYMEAPDGVQQIMNRDSYYLPIDQRREGLMFGVLRIFNWAGRWPLMQLLTSPMLSLVVLGRWLSMYACKLPVWPQSVENGCQVEPNDAYQRNWQQNSKFTFREKYWPLICFAVGGVVDAYLIRLIFF